MNTSTPVSLLGSFEALVGSEFRRTQPARLLLGHRYMMISQEEFRSLLMFGHDPKNFDDELKDDVCRIWLEALYENGIDIDFTKTPDALISMIGREIGIDRMIAARVQEVPVEDILG